MWASVACWNPISFHFLAIEIMTKYKHGKLGTRVFSLKKLETYLNSHISKKASEVVDKLSTKVQVV